MSYYIVYMLELKHCPICEEENIQISYDNRKQQFRLYCNSCKKDYILSKKVKIECPQCKSIDIRFDEDETTCGECNLVLATTYDYVAGFKIKLPWGLIL